MKKLFILFLAFCSIVGQAQQNPKDKFIFDWWANSEENPLTRPEVLDIIDLNCASCITLDASSNATQIRSVNGLFTFNCTACYQLVNYHGGKALYRSSGSGRYLSTAPAPQQNYSVMTMVYQTLASPIIWVKNAGTNTNGFRLLSNVPNLAATVALAGTDNLAASTEHTIYWSQTASGYALGNDGVQTNSNATANASVNDNAISWLNSAALVNGVTGYAGSLVVFKRALTSDELIYWNQYLKSQWMNGYKGTTPYSAERDGNNFKFWASNDFGQTFNPNNTASASWYNQYDKTIFTLKGINGYLVNTPHDGIESIKSDYAFQTVDASTLGTFTQAQPFTVYSLVNFHPAYKANLNLRQLIRNTQSTDNIAIMHDKANGVLRMQGVGTVGTGGGTVPFTVGKWSIVKAVYNGASSYLEVDGVQSSTFDAGSLGLTGTTTIGSGSDIFLAALGVYNGVPSATIDTETKSYLSKLRNPLPDYLTPNGTYVVQDNFNTYHYGFGGIEKSGNTLYSVVRRGQSHADLQAQVMFSKSTDLNTTWSTPISITGSLTTNFDYRDPRITRLSSGRLICNYFLRFNNSVWTIKCRYSDDDGTTWSSEISVVPTTVRAQIGVSGYIIQLTNGDLLMPFYGFDALQTNQINGVMRSTNNGLTWLEDSIFNNPTTSGTGTAFQEFNILLLQTGEVVGFIRREGTVSTEKEIWRTVGTVGNPITWTTPVKCADCYGSPGVSQRSDGTIDLMCRYRSLNTWVDWFTSTDKGVNFTRQKFPENHTDLWTYGRVLEGYAFWTQQNSDSKSFWRVLKIY